ncbi:P-II family nitrogen regulator [Alicyclobacillus fastidiosus]|uniref:P-II family nitrogen regulator n=1 Tax=Alicyclobacillus fastidiosus TaxID=392011 RepID=A0ABV5AFA8_9BACL|nr:P-II family nitrogen regulator [Alicyclobacillus fastidiosus]WEH09663.1 P-II family nitrogen regulator [Alicyclobacillus fastidiosus]
MKRIDAVIRPEKLQAVIKALRKTGVNGFTVIPVQGRGQERNTHGVYRGHTYDINLHPKIKLEIVVSDNYLERTIEAIIGSAQTGEMGDGKIFVYEVLDAYNIRTGVVDETIDELKR